MTTKIRLINIFIILLLIIGGCAWINQQMDKDAKLAGKYYSKGLEYEQNGALPQALEQYKLALTVTPQDRKIIEKRNQTESKLRAMAERHYMAGMKLYKQGRIRKARRQFLLALKDWPEHSKSIEMITPRKKENQIKYTMHTIKPGESISKLAKMYYGDYQEFPTIVRFNNFTDATRVQVGQKIKIPEIPGLPFMVPKYEEEIAGKPSSDSIPYFQKPGKDILSGEYVEHIIKPGESISELAKMYYDNYQKYPVIAKFNNLSDIARLDIGQVIRIPEIKDVPFKKVVKKPDLIILPPKIEKEEEDKKIASKLIQNYRHLGIELFNQKKYQEAIIELNKVINADPDDKIALNYLYLSHYQNGIIFFDKGKYLFAKKDFEKALIYNKNCSNCLDYIDRCKEKYLEVHYNNGLIFFANEKLDKAIEEWNLVYEIDPDYKQVKKNINKAKLFLRRFKEIRNSR